MDKKKFEESLTSLFPECGQKAVPKWLAFAEECTEMGQSPDFTPVSDKDATIGIWLDAIYRGLYRIKEEYGAQPAELICGLSEKHCLYPWEMMKAAKYLKNGSETESLIRQSVEGLLDER